MLTVDDECADVPGFVATTTSGRDAGDSSVYKYRYDAYLGCGATGSTWRIVRNSDHATFALKVTRLSASPLARSMRAHLDVELTFMEQLRHFACVRLVDTYCTSERLYLVMEYCNAADLHYQFDYIRRHTAALQCTGACAKSSATAAVSDSPTHAHADVASTAPPSPARAFMDEYCIRYILVQLLLGLYYLHNRCCIVHCDIKPANVLVTTEGLVKIADFGLAMHCRDDASASSSHGAASCHHIGDDCGCVNGTCAASRRHGVCGTPPYVAPEVWQHRRYGRAADMWSLGVLVYECMTGVTPFAHRCRDEKEGGNALRQLRHCVLHEAPPPLPSDVYSNDLCELVYSLLCKSPERRPMAADLLALPYVQDALEQLPQVLHASHASAEVLGDVAEDVALHLRQRAYRKRRDLSTHIRTTHTTHPAWTAANMTTASASCSGGSGVRVPTTMTHLTTTSVLSAGNLSSSLTLCGGQGTTSGEVVCEEGRGSSWVSVSGTASAVVVGFSVCNGNPYQCTYGRTHVSPHA